MSIIKGSNGGAVTKIDESKSIIDLTTSLINATSSSNPLINGAVEVYQWLGREGLDRYQLAACLGQANGVAYPNSTGLQYCDRVDNAITRNPVTFLFLQKSGSLGKLMIRDPKLRWVVSTAACLYRFTSDAGMVTNTICSLILRHHHTLNEGLYKKRNGLPPLPTVDGETYKEFESSTHQERMILYPIMNRIVSSIWLNIVNTQSDTIDLPQELQNICPRGHNLNERSLCQIMYMSERVRDKVVIESTFFLSNMTLWLLVHFKGTIEVVVGTKRMYKKPGALREEVEIRVKQFCDAGIPCRSSTGAIRSRDIESYAVKIFHKLSAEPFLKIDVAEIQEGTRLENPGTRRSLYNFPRTHLEDTPITNKAISIQIKANAQSIMKWMLSRRVLRPATSSTSPLGFNVALKQEMDHLKTIFNVSEILYKIPDLINAPWESSLDRIPSVIYSPPKDNVDDWAPAHVKIDPRDQPKWPAFIICCFPMLQDLLMSARRLCSCWNCNSTEDVDPMGWKLKQGCLRQHAFDMVMVTIAHGIADSLGCDGVSGTDSITDAVNAAKAALFGFCVQGPVLDWNSWFMTAATVYLGCRYIPSAYEPYTAIQYGELCLVAPWLDLHKEIEISGCFRVILGKGRLTGSGGGSIQEEFAAVEIEETQAASIKSREATELKRRRQPALPVSLAGDEENETDEQDKSSTEGDIFLVPNQRNTYKLAYRIRTENHSRFIDPSKTLTMTLQLLISHQCQHERPKFSDYQKQGMIRNFNFDEIIGLWPDEAFWSRDNENIFSSSLLESHFKYNVAVSLIPDRIISLTALPFCDRCLATIKNSNHGPTTDVDYQWVLRKAQIFGSAMKSKQIALGF